MVTTLGEQMISQVDRQVSRSGRHRVLIVDDSAFMRRLVSDIVASSGEFEVVGTARDGKDALELVRRLSPDIVTLDVEMPEMDGLAVLDAIMRDMPTAVVMLSAAESENGVDATLASLERGAVDFVRKPSGAISLDLELVGDRLLSALRIAAQAGSERPGSIIRPPAPAPDLKQFLCKDNTRTVKPATPAVGVRKASAPAHVVVIAASTGGPAALAEVIPKLPEWDDTAVLIVQHMPPGFTAGFSRRLDSRSLLAVSEAVDGGEMRSGSAYVAPSGVHLRIQPVGDTLTLAFDMRDPLWGVRPSADILFESAAEAFGFSAVGVVMTGMGRDGAEGLRHIRQAGGIGIVQSSESCVVAGMPEAARRIAGCDTVVDQSDIATAISEMIEFVRQRCREPIRKPPLRGMRSIESMR